MENEFSSSSNAYTIPKNSQRSCGRWTQEEHRLFIIGLTQFGKNWKKIEQLIQTRTGSQIRSHAQKYFNKLGKQSDKVPSQNWDAQTSVPNYNGTLFVSDLDGIPISKSLFISKNTYLEENQNQVQLYPHQTFPYLLEEHLQNQFNHLSPSSQPQFQIPADAKGHYLSYFFQHIFSNSNEALCIDFYQQFVDHSKRVCENSQAEKKQQSNESKRKISFTLFQHQEQDRSNQEIGQTTNRIIITRV